MTIHDIPPLNAALNATCFVLLVCGFILVKMKHRKAHGICMGMAFVVSALFLVGYVTHKILMQGIHTSFNGTGMIRTFYYVMLISHIILAIVNLPLVIMTLRAGLAGNLTRHRNLAKITLPMWTYVSITGVLVYFMLYHWYPPVV